MTPVAVASAFGLQSAIQPFMEFSVKQPTPPGDGTIEWCGPPFVRVARIQPKTRGDGTPCTYSYPKAAQEKRHRHGEGPFCCFDVGGLPAAPGIYAVTLNRELVVYVGITTKSLKRSWGPHGFGSITCRNCSVDGQSTHCKVNHAILQEVQRKQAVDLWIREMEEPRTLKRQLIRELEPPWNDRGYPSQGTTDL